MMSQKNRFVGQSSSNDPSLPDDNYIERLFPKCPPTSKQNDSKGSDRLKGQSRKRQNRPKLHQHSRRELEAKRNLTKNQLAEQNNQNNNDNTYENGNKSFYLGRNLRNGLNTNNNSSDESSDNEQAKGRKRFAKSYIGSSFNSSSSNSHGRRSGKYMASQNLLLKLKKSHSSYDQTDEGTSLLANNDIKNYPAEQNPTSDSNYNSGHASKTVRINSGIVESKTCFTIASDNGSSISEEPTKFHHSQLVGGQRHVTLSQRNTKIPDNTDRHKKAWDENSTTTLVNLDTESTQSNSVDSPTLTHTNGSGIRKSTSNQLSGLFRPEQANSQSSSLASNNQRDNNSISGDRQTTALEEPIEEQPMDKVCKSLRPNTSNQDYLFSNNGKQGFQHTTNMPANNYAIGTTDVNTTTDENTIFISEQTNKQTNFKLDEDRLKSDLIEPIRESSEVDNLISSPNQDINKNTPILKPSLSQSKNTLPSKLREHSDRDSVKNLDYGKNTKKSSQSAESSMSVNNIEITEIFEDDSQVIVAPSGEDDEHIELHQIHQDHNHNSLNKPSGQLAMSEQLLVADVTDEFADELADDINLVKNDTSTEELCNNEQMSLNISKTSSACEQKNLESENPLATWSNPSNASNNNQTRYLSHHRLSNSGPLQTVDEQAEVYLEESSPTEIADKKFSVDQLVGSVDSVGQKSGQSNKKAPISPGYPQRISPSNWPSTTPAESSNESYNDNGSSAISTRRNLNENCTRSETTCHRVRFLDDDQNSASNNASESKNCPTDSRQDDIAAPPMSHEQSSFKSPQMARHSMDHHSQMPRIEEAPHELELSNEVVATKSMIDTDEANENQITNGLCKVNLSNESVYPAANTNIAGSISSIRANREEPKHSVGSALGVAATPTSNPTSSSRVAAIDTLASSGSPSAMSTNLRHHRIPNKTSHYSLIRSSSSNSNHTPSASMCGNSNNNNNSGLLSETAVEPNTSMARSSSLRFNTLSDGESDQEAQEHCSTYSIGGRSQAVLSSNDNAMTKKCDTISKPVLMVGVANGGSSSSNGILNQQRSHQTSGASVDNDDLTPTTKTALIFPRLDEGLSSDAESCDDGVEEEDERAVDADVDADEEDYDDDNDGEDDDDDADDDDILPVLERGNQAIQLGQSIDVMLRQQQQQQQQQQQHQQKSQSRNLIDQEFSSSSYGGYMNNQDQLDKNDIKTLTNYSNQNGGQTNYWMGMGNNHSSGALMAQPSSSSSSQQFGGHRNTNGSNGSSSNSNSQHSSATKVANNSFSREEAKSANRFSSDTDNETDRLICNQRIDQLKMVNSSSDTTALATTSLNQASDLQSVSDSNKSSSNSREVLIEGVLFNVKYLGSTHSDYEGRSDKEDRIHQAEMAVHEVKFRNGDSQPVTDVQLFISTEKIMVLDDKNRKIMMDHSLRTISYIADIGDAIVLIVRKKSTTTPSDASGTGDVIGRPVSKISCHVFESQDSHTITKSISQAFQVAYTELLKANGAGDSGSYLPKELDYQDVLNSQEMSTDELDMFARKENQREVIVPKEKGEILGLSIVESGWGSILPTVVIASLKQDGPAHRCKKLSVGDQILSVNGISLVGLPLAECHEILRRTRNQRVARLSVVPCPITVEVKIKRPDTKYQLGFSVQNGVICSLLRGGIAERGGVRVGHRIMSINGTTVVGVPHEKIVTLLASSVGEIRMKTCLTSLYRLILGEDNPVHF